jgi:hypothetical protein
MQKLILVVKIPGCSQACEQAFSRHWFLGQINNVKLLKLLNIFAIMVGQAQMLTADQSKELTFKHENELCISCNSSSLLQIFPYSPQVIPVLYFFLYLSTELIYLLFHLIHAQITTNNSYKNSFEQNYIFSEKQREREKENNELVDIQ